MKLLDYAHTDVSQQQTLADMPVLPPAPQGVQVKMSRSRRQFWLHFALVCFFLLVESCALLLWGIVTNGAILPPFVEKTPVVAPCAHVRIYFGKDGTPQTGIDESCR